MIIGLGDYLLRYPTIRKQYLRFCVAVEEYSRFLPFKWYYIQKRLQGVSQKTFLTFPQKPSCFHIIYQICYMNGYRITNDPKEAASADVIIFFEDKTKRIPSKTLQTLRKKYPVVNYLSRDISKKRVTEVFEKIFGYSLAVNPLTCTDAYVKKADENSLHNGMILYQPEKQQKGYIYQKLVNNVKGNEAVDIRVPVFRDTIPFVYIKKRLVQKRFHSLGNSAKIVQTQKVLSQAEQKKILTFCKAMGLDYAELDVLRDTYSKKIYIVDANNTPGGPPHMLPKDDVKKVLQIMSDAFEKTFIRPQKPYKESNKVKNLSLQLTS